MDSHASVLVSGGDSRADGRVGPSDLAAGGSLRRSRFDAGGLRRKTLLGAGLLLATLVASCAAARLAPPDPSHPASPEAAESTLAEPAAFLGQPGGVIGGEEEPASEMPHGPGMMHGGGRMMQHGAGGAGHGH